MFNPPQLRTVLTLHEKSFALLRWVRSSLRTGRLSFAVVHDNTDSATAASEWIRRHLRNLPAGARPPEEQLDVFGRLFVSFLTTSYKLNPTSVRLTTSCGCYCSYCAFLQASPHLDPRNPSKRDFQTAQELKHIYLGKLASELQVTSPTAAIQQVISSKELAEPVALATWGAELIRRSEFASQGEAVLALWRQFAWKEDKPKSKFKLTADLLLAAEKDIVASLARSVD